MRVYVPTSRKELTLPSLLQERRGAACLLRFARARWCLERCRHPARAVHEPRAAAQHRVRLAALLSPAESTQERGLAPARHAPSHRGWGRARVVVRMVPGARHRCRQGVREDKARGDATACASSFHQLGCVEREVISRAEGDVAEGGWWVRSERAQFRA